MDEQTAALAPEQSRPSDTHQSGAVLGHDIIQVEANLLCHPFFALAKRDRTDRQTIEIFGQRTLPDESRQQYRLRVARGSDRAYPGLLSRKLHYALLHIANTHYQKTGNWPNPIPFTWGQVCTLLGDSRSGRTAERYKQALHDTAAAYITTNLAFLARLPDKTKVPLGHSDRETGYHLYDKVLFANEVHAGKVYDTNAVWISDWYAANLTNFYTGPLKFNLWLELNSLPIASRIYELLLYKFTRSIPHLRINYQTLCNLLPVKCWPKPSKAKQQLNPAFQLLGGHGVLSRVDWTISKTGELQLLIKPGDQLQRNVGPAAERILEPTDTLVFDHVTLVETFNDQTPSDQLVCKFQALRGREGRWRPTPAESAFAQSLYDNNPPQLIDRLLPKVAEELSLKVRYFNASERVWKDFLADYQKKALAAKKLEAQRQRERKQRSEEARQAEEQREHRRHLESLFESLSSDDSRQFWDWATDQQTSTFSRSQILKYRRANQLRLHAFELFETWYEAHH